MGRKKSFKMRRDIESWGIEVERRDGMRIRNRWGIRDGGGGKRGKVSK